MIFDSNLTFFDRETPTAAKAVQIDAAGNDIGAGTPLYLCIMQNAETNATPTTFALTTSDAETGGDELVSISIKKTGRTETACVALPTGYDYRKYLVLTPTGGAGTCTAALALDPQAWRAMSDGL